MGRKNPYKIRLSNGLVVKLITEMSINLEIEGKTLSVFSRDTTLVENAEEIVTKFFKIWKEKLEICSEMVELMAKVCGKASYKEKKISRRLYKKVKSCTETMVAERDQAKFICKDLKTLYKNCLGREFED